MSIWEGTVSIMSDNGLLSFTRCSTKHHAGGLISFYGKIGLFGKYAKIEANDCHSGHIGNKLSYAGGLQLGANFSAEYLRDPANFTSIYMVGEHSSIEAHDCTSWGASGILVFKTNLCTSSPNVAFRATGNRVQSGQSIQTHHHCSVEFLNNNYYSRWPLNVYIDSNVCEVSDCTDIYVSDARHNYVFPIEVSGYGTINN